MLLVQLFFKIILVDYSFDRLGGHFRFLSSVVLMLVSEPWAPRKAEQLAKNYWKERRKAEQLAKSYWKERRKAEQLTKNY